MTGTAELPKVGSIITRGRTDYTVIRHGCATRWAECPHGERAITVVRVDGKAGAQTECLGG